jgi:osmotically-inducible protein OsmY
MNAFKSSLIAGTIALALGASVAGAQDTATPADRSVGQVVDDATITATVKAKLLADERTKAFDVNVDTAKGVVTLTGGADSGVAKSAAQELAGQVEGVILIRNELVVAAPGSEARQDANTATASGEVREAMDEAGDGIDDAWITSKVKTQLLADAAVQGTQITVETRANVVTLGGSADSAAARTKAIEIAAATKGVARVDASGLAVKP